MKKEFEIKFLNINKRKIRKKLRELRAKKKLPEYLVQREVFDFPDFSLSKKGGWIRVRDEGDKITVAYKISKPKLKSVEELEFEVNDFNKSCAFMKAIGLKRKSYQETKREKWELNGAEITIDTWPGLDPLIEIEAKNQKMLRKITKKLGLGFNKGMLGSVDLVYQKELGIPLHIINNKIPEITFKKPPGPYKEKSGRVKK